jgi:hypothetical protein
MYNMSSAMVSGSMTISWLQGGARMRQDMNMKTSMSAPRGRSNGGPATIKGWTIYDGTYVYTYMPMMGSGGGKRVMRMKLPPEVSRRMMMGGLNSLAGPAGQSKVVGKATLLGKPCQIRESTMSNQRVKARTRLWMWQGLPLRIESTMQVSGMQAGRAPNAAASQTRTIRTNLVATKVDTSSKPSAALFKVPAGYSVQDMRMPTSMGRLR